MKAQRTRLGMNTLGSLLVALALCATGCVAQVGQGTEDPGSTPEQITGQQAVTTPVAQPYQQPEQKLDKARVRVIYNADGTLVVGTPEQGAEEMRLNVDPSAPVTDDGDGREPDPHPWHADITIAH